MLQAGVVTTHKYFTFGIRLFLVVDELLVNVYAFQSLETNDIHVSPFIGLYGWGIILSLFKTLF